MPEVIRVLFLDDEPHVRAAGQQTLELAGWHVTCHDDARGALAGLPEDFPGIIVSDVRMPGMDGLAFLAAVQERDPELPIVLITGHGDVTMAVEALKSGAYDFIEKPYPAERLIESVGRALEKRRLVLENRSLRRELEIVDGPGPRLIGRSPAMREVRRRIAAMAATDADVLILGETGTGKEVAARSLHELGPRRTGRFVALNCGAFPETIIESELFGHEPGAFTGATARRIGKLEHASGGTLFLDEIESMPMALQVKLLRALQERSIERLGSNTAIPLDLRVVAATKVDLRKAADDGAFRADLYYRLNVLTLALPPLRDRGDDILLLFHHFATEAAARCGREAPDLPPHQAARLRAASWPGNVRELRNCAERFVLLGDLMPDDGPATTVAAAGDGTALPEKVAAFESSLIRDALERSGGDIRAAAEALGVPRKTLYDKLRKYGLDRATFA